MVDNIVREAEEAASYGKTCMKIVYEATKKL